MNKRSKINWNYLLIAPALIISVCVILVPGIMTVVYSFTDWNGLSPDINFIGLQNYQELFHDNVFFDIILVRKVNQYLCTFATNNQTEIGHGWEESICHRRC